MSRLLRKVRRLGMIFLRFQRLKSMFRPRLVYFVLTSSLLLSPTGLLAQPPLSSDEHITVGPQTAEPVNNQPSPQIRSSASPLTDSLPQQDDKQSLQLQQPSEKMGLSSDAALNEELPLMTSLVQILDRDSASRWLSGFISSSPWNCPFRQRSEWIKAILYAVERNQLPICKEILGLVSTLIAIESGFHADPLVVDPSRRGNMEGILKRAELKLCEEYGSLLSIPPMPKYYAAYKEKYWPHLLACQTEGDVERVAGRLADELKKDAEKFPAIVRSVVEKKITKLANVVRSKGSMQLKLIRARPAMMSRGEVFTDQELIDYMYTMNGGVDVGVATLKPMFVQYGARYAKKGDLSWLFFVGMDYHYGPFSSRNMMEQMRIRDLSGKKIAIDGGFLNHDEDGNPEEKDSETLLAAEAALPSLSRQTILKAFLLERYPQYIYTDFHYAIADAHRKRFGETPFAVIGEIRMGVTAEIKFGTTWTTRLYLDKLDRYLNLIPWDN